VPRYIIMEYAEELPDEVLVAIDDKTDALRSTAYSDAKRWSRRPYSDAHGQAGVSAPG
jgi:hypothetical protein